MRDFHLLGRSAVFAENGMCATSHPLAAKVAVQIMEAGGNAMDAAIAVAGVLGVCEPQMTGIGGDCFVLVKPAGEQRVVGLNGSGRAPAALSAAKMRADGHKAVPVGGPESVTIPGAIDAFCRLSDDWGKLGLKASLAPGIHYAENGVPVAPRTSFDWKLNAGNLQGVARDYLLLNGKAPEPGQIYRAPKIAEVLRRVAMGGRDAFYEGEVAEDMVSSLNALGGVHTLDDFANAACEYTEPVAGDYKGTELLEHAPNTHGITAIMMNNMLAHFDIPSMDPFGTQRAHIEAEVAKLAYDARDRFLSDAERTQRLEHMLSLDTAASLAALVDPKRAMQSARAITGEVHKDTVLISVVDKDRMAVSMIYSIYHAFGSGIASSKFGINFHNRGTGFTLEEGHPAEAMGGKRPVHTIIPGMLKRAGKVIMPFGTMGGAYQPTGHSRVLTNMVDFGMNPQQAMDGPRAFAFDGELRIERGYSPAVHQELADMGHNVVIPVSPLGGSQAILIDYEKGVLQGASDPRKDGCALGY